MQMPSRLQWIAIPWLFTLVAATPVSHADNYPDLPDIGDSSGKVISPTQEMAMGENLMRWLRQNHLIIEDPLIQDYIDSIGHRLLPASDHNEQAFTFFVVDDITINAFAAPGGFIGVNTGLILTTRNESELAAVLAHEIAHITQRHIARSLEAASKNQLITTAAILAAILVGQQNGELSEAALSAGIASGAQLQINFTRANEQEADRIGIKTLGNSGYDPVSMATFFDRMAKATRLQGPQLPEFLSTHPVSVSRIADARNRAAQTERVRIEENLNYHLIHARIRALSGNDTNSTEQRFRENLKNGQYNHEDAERYGYVLALLQNHNYAEAGKQLKPLLDKDPGRIAYQIAGAQLEKRLGNTDGAIKIYEKMLLNFPHNHALSIYYAETLLEVNRPAVARSFLQGYTRTHTPDAYIHRLFARASTEAGHAAEGHQHMAEYYYLTGQTKAAIQQLTMAAGTKELDFYQASRIEARLQELQREAKKEKAN